MFKKLLSNLPFNPSLITQVAFYSQRLKKESFVRGMGVATMVLAMFLQAFAVISPPESSLAQGPNDIVDGGFSSAQDAADLCNRNVQNFKKILAYYGVTCAQLTNSSKTVTKNIKSTDHDKKIHSLGRTPQPKINPKNGKPSGQYEVNIPGIEETLYMKNLWYWDTNAYSTYKVLQTKNSQGDIIYILYSCANVATVGEFEPEPEPEPEPTPAPKPDPKAPPTIPGTMACESLNARSLGKRQFIFTATTSGKDYKVTNYAFDWGDGKKLSKNTSLKKYSSVYTYPDNKGYLATVVISGSVLNKQGTLTKKTVTCSKKISAVLTPAPKPDDVCPNIPGDQSDVKECYPCPEAEDGGDIACLEFDKVARNDSLGIENAHGTTAKPGNIIIYTLSVKNNGQTDFKDFKFKENLVDILEYANIKDPAGGELNNKQFITWEARDIPAKSTVKLAFSVQVKDKIPNTPRSASDQGSYDLCMNNVFYDKDVSICVEPPINKQIENVASTLPNTGPGETMALTIFIVSIMGYFFARNKLMVEELTILRDEFASGGTQ